jgi:hypothetical protein
MEYSIYNGWRYLIAGSDIWFDAPVNLPAGSQITQVYLDYYDSSATGDVWLTLYGRVPGSDSPVFSYSTVSSGALGFGRLELNLTGSNIIVDNAGHTYHVRVGLGAIGLSTRFLDAIICHKPIP